MMKTRNTNTLQRRTSRWLATGLTTVAIALSGAMSAQVNTYTFAESTETYAQITGTTSTAIGDDGTQTAIPIGFTFVFDGVARTTFSITTNGMIRMDGGAISSGWTNSLAVASSNRPLIAPFWDDNNMTGGEIRYSTTGTAPNRVLTVNWHNSKIGGFGSTAGAAVSSILRLYETTNVIEMVYSNPYTTTNSVSASVGLNGASTFLSVTPAATSTASGVTANNSINASVMANLAGKKLTFTPPMPCMGVPNAGSITSPVAVCSGNTVVLSATGLSSGIGITYAWEESPDGVGSWAPVVGGSGAATASYTTTAITMTRYFRIVTTCSTGPDVNNSNVVTVNLTTGGIAEDFSSGTIVGNCWSQSGTGSAVNLRYNAASGFGVGTGSIIWDFFTQSANATLIYTSPVVTPIVGVQYLQFDVAGRQYSVSAIDSIYIEESNDGGTNWTLVASGSNETGSVFNTVGLATTELNTPLAGEWASRSFLLTPGTDRVRFRGVSKFGNNVLIDNIALGGPPACSAPVATSDPVPNCPGGFDVDVNITAFGEILAVPETSATIEYTVNGNPQTPVAVGSTGITTLTGFSDGDLVVVTVTNDGDNSCNLTLASDTYTCPPVNDLCAGAIMVECNSVTTGNTTNATQTGAPTAGCDNTGDPYVYFATGRGVWYTVQGFDGQMTASLCGSSFDTQIWIGTDGCGVQNCVAGNDDAFALCASSGSRSIATWTGSSAETYYIYVTGWAANFGAYTLTMTCGDFNPACTENGLNLEFQNDANPGGVTWEIEDETGSVVVVSGTNAFPANSIGTQAICLP
ncbi:MAG: hypothetical protein KDC00_14305, partial [Flavobacteriales bacterium]|nr:hypothetical protein [Flavobacteriales bacterium]